MSDLLAVNVAVFQGLAMGVIVTLIVGAGLWYANNKRSVVDRSASGFRRHEERIVKLTIEALEKIRSDSSCTSKRQRTECDKAFRHFTYELLVPYSKEGLSARSAAFSTETLIPKVLKFETQSGIEFHKGALFYNTSLAYLDIGDDARFEYYLAMASEEDCRTHFIEGKRQNRGLHSLKTGNLSEQTLQERLDFAADLLNGKFSSCAVDYAFAVGSAITANRFDTWRRNLEPLHHGELFRLLYEVEVFLGNKMPSYAPVRDNPFVMLRLVKALAHLAQWIESRLTDFQSTLPADTITAKNLGKKLQDDPNLAALVTAAGNQANFGGNNPDGAVATDAELKMLISDAATAASCDNRHWRILRVFYIVRNSTAHQIDDALSFHSDLAYLTELLQVVFVSYFVIEKLETGNAP